MYSMTILHTINHKILKMSNQHFLTLNDPRADGKPNPGCTTLVASLLHDMFRASLQLPKRSLRKVVAWY